MRIEIDFANKTIEIKDNVSIGELVEKLKELNFPEWESYTLKQSYVQYPIYPYYPNWPVYPLNPVYSFAIPAIAP